MGDIRTIFVILFCATFFLGVGYAIYEELHYWIILPTSPDLVLRRVHLLLVNHGSLRYGTQQELEVLTHARWAAFVGAVCGFAGGVLNVLNPK
jgi:hypothetical protein